MPFALFEDGERVTRIFPTRDEVWEAAERADLVETGPRGEKFLDNNLEIRPCESTLDEAVNPGSDFIASRPAAEPNR